MRSKSLVRFLNRAARFDEDLELISVVGLAVAAGDLNPEAGGPLFSHVDASSHPRLAKAKVTDHNRSLVFGHLRKTVYASHVKDLYEDFTDYLGEVVASAARQGFAPDVLRGEYKVQLGAADLLARESWEGVCEGIVDALNQRLDALGTFKKIEFLDRRLKLDLDATTVELALSFLDLRHLLVHCDGVADEGFCSRHSGFDARPGRSVHLDEGLARDARAAITALVEHIDTRAVTVGILSADDLQ